MKSHIKTYSLSALQKEIDAETMKVLKEYKDELYEKVSIDCFDQAMAVCFIALEQMGWKKKRLTDFKDKVDDVAHLMYTGIMGREVTTRDALKHLKDAYGIDFEESQYKDEYDKDAEASQGSKKQSAGCFACKHAEWDADGCWCRIHSERVGGDRLAGCDDRIFEI